MADLSFYGENVGFTGLVTGAAGGVATPVSTVNPLPTAGGTGAGADQVQGVAANGAAVVGNPVRIGGSDGTTTRDVRTDSAGNLYALPAPATSGGVSGFRAMSGTSGVIKASAGNLYSLHIYNGDAALRYLSIYDKATAPTLSTDTPIVTFPLTGTAVTHIPLAADIGQSFAAGIAWAFHSDGNVIPTLAGTVIVLSALFK